MMKKIVLESSEKSDFRKKCLINIKRVKSKRYKEYDIMNSILMLIHILKPKNILSFIPMSHEVNINKVNLQLKRLKGVNIFVPQVYKDSFRLIKYRYPMIKNRFGIYEPIGEYSYKFDKLDLAIVPILGVDSNFARVGFGKGMYDRYFYRKKFKTKKIFTQLDLNYSKKVVTDFYDIKADYIVSHKTSINIKRLNNGRVICRHSSCLN